MKDKRCFICKYQGKINMETTPNQLFGNKDKNTTILLCYGHSVELFKSGQTNFVLKYKPNFVHYYGADEEDKHTISYF